MTAELGFVCPLFVPADRPDRFAKAAATGADAIILDLEDAVAEDRKAFARSALTTDFTGLPVVVRINGVDSRWHADDVAALSALCVAAVMVPKAEPGAALGGLIDRLAERACPVIALVETSRGLAGAREVASLSGVGRLAFGSVDFCAEFDMAHTREALLAARFELVLASRLAGLCGPLDGVTLSVDDAAATGEDAVYARSLGFAGKLCIHPRQVQPILAGFRPSDRDVDWARRVLASGDGAAKIDGQMIDRPVRERAHLILSRHAASKGGTG